MPPSIILKIMKILAGEVGLREETRELEQAREGMEEGSFDLKANRLSKTQQQLTSDTADAVDMILALPEGSQNFGKEVQQLRNAAMAMQDATEILSRPETGSEAIAAETEAIEWLLQAKRSKGGGGGGGNQAGNGARTGRSTNVSAVALLGDADADDEKVEKRETVQASGRAGEEYPDEFRKGLDAYFEQLEQSAENGGAQ